MKEMTIRGVSTFIDDEDVHFIQEYDWFVEMQKHGCIYYMAQFIQSNGVSIKIKLHRLIAGATKIIDGVAYNTKDVVDHRNRNTLDNTRDNLRLCTKSQNSMNSKLPIDSTSGYKGVSWKKDRQKWKAYLTVNHKQVHLGYYTDIADAVQARVNGARFLFGEFFAEGVEGVARDF